MKLGTFVIVACVNLPGGHALAQTQPALETAAEMQACGERAVVSARWMRDGSLKVRCDRSRSRRGNPDVPQVTPGPTNIVGLLAPALGLGAAVAATAAGSSSPSATSSTGRH